MNFRVLLMLHVAYHRGLSLDHFLFLLFINEISQFTTDGCLTNLYADDSMIHASGDNILQVQQKFTDSNV